MAEKGAKGPSPAIPRKKGGGGLMKIIILVVGVGVLGGGGFFAYRKFFKAKPAAEAGTEGGDAQTQAAPEPKGIHIVEKPELAIVPLEPFLVNLADTDGNRFLRCTMKMVLDSKEHFEKLNQNEAVVAKIRDAFLVLMSTKIGADLVTPDGKEKLRKELVDKGNEIMGKPWAVDLLFTDFVVQM